MTALELEEIHPDVSIAELERRWGISRNALKARAKALGVELQRKGPTLTVWPGDRVADGDRLDAHCKAGGSLASFPGAVAVTPHGGSELAVTSHDGSQLALLAAAVAAAMPVAPVDPLRRAKALAEAAELGVALSSLELAEVLGMSPATVSSWPDGHQPRPGFKLLRCKQKPGGAVWWVVQRDGATASIRAIAGAASGRSVGFGACLTVEAVSLPCF